MPTSLTLSTKILRDEGITHTIVEHRHHITRRKRDLFGFIDIVALLPVVGILGIQCGIGDRQLHLRKISGPKRDVAEAWLYAGGRIEVWTWSRVRRTPRSKTSKQVVWKRVVDEITLGVLADAERS